jgi:hypothetical protein
MTALRGMDAAKAAPMTTLLQLAEALQQSAIGTAIREAPVGYPFIEGLHLLGLALSFGLIVFIDLRLAGLLLRDVPARRLLDPLRPWVFAGFLGTFTTGVLLFWAAAADLLANPSFIAKVVLMALALANALAFEWAARRRHEALDAPLLPARIRRAGWTSLGLWTLVTIAGRLIPYYAHS